VTGGPSHGLLDRQRRLDRDRAFYRDGLADHVHHAAGRVVADRHRGLEERQTENVGSQFLSLHHAFTREPGFRILSGPATIVPKISVTAVTSINGWKDAPFVIDVRSDVPADLCSGPGFPDPR
jgi:hypothetical protein